MRGSMLPLSDDDRISPGPRELKPMGSADWCYQTLRLLKQQWLRVEQEHEWLTKTLEELEVARAWERIPPDSPYGSEEAMLRAVVGASRAEIDARVAEVQRLAKMATPPPTRSEAAKKRERTRRCRKQGDDTTSDGITRGHRGTSAQYVMDRIKRDAPEIHKDVLAGKYPSAEAAARAAGISKPRIQVIAEPENIARAAISRLTPEQIATLIALLNAHLEPPSHQQGKEVTPCSISPNTHSSSS
jgi:hypothetical protein